MPLTLKKKKKKSETPKALSNKQTQLAKLDLFSAKGWPCPKVLGKKIGTTSGEVEQHLENCKGTAVALPNWQEGPPR